MNRSRCLKALSKVKKSLKVIEENITNYHFRDAHDELSLFTMETIDYLSNELTAARKIIHHVPEKNPHCHPLPAYFGDKKE